MLQHWSQAFIPFSAIVLLTNIAACTPALTGSVDSTETVPAEKSTAEVSAVLVYDGPAEGIPVMARYPDTMQVEAIGSSEGVGVFFTFLPQSHALDEAEVHIFLPAGAASTDDLMPFITGDNSLIQTSGWYLDGARTDGVAEFPYNWFELVFDISTDFEQTGHILIGQTEGQAIRVTLLYPAAMADDYWPAAKTVLDSLEFDPRLLPITVPEGEFEGEDPATMCNPTTEPC